MQENSPHMGRLVDAKLKEIGMTRAEFGRRINTSRQNVNTMLGKEHIRVAMLQKASRVLKYNFFEVYGRNLPNPQDSEFIESARSKGLKVIIEISDPEALRAFLEWWDTYKES